MNILKKNAGLTLIEVIIVVALLAVATSGIGIMLNNSFKESNTLSGKVHVQNSVVALMNKFEQTIKEASVPIANSDFAGNQIIIFKPNSEVLFTFDSETSIVTCEEKDLEGNLLGKIEYPYIKSINVLLKSSAFGALVDLKGSDGINEYSLNNVYYSRNTISMSELREQGKYLLTTVIGSKDKGNSIIETVARVPGEEITLGISNDGFNKWIVTTGNVYILDKSATTITFTMPSEDVCIIADFDEIL